MGSQNWGFGDPSTLRKTESNSCTGGSNDSWGSFHFVISLEKTNITMGGLKTHETSWRLGGFLPFSPWKKSRNGETTSGENLIPKGKQQQKKQCSWLLHKSKLSNGKTKHKVPYMKSELVQGSGSFELITILLDSNMSLGFQPPLKQWVLI